MQRGFHTEKIQVSPRKHRKDCDRFLILIQKLVKNGVGAVPAARQNGFGKVEHAGLQILHGEQVNHLRGNFAAAGISAKLFQFVQRRLKAAAAKCNHPLGVSPRDDAAALFGAGANEFFELRFRKMAEWHRGACPSGCCEKFSPDFVAALVKIERQVIKNEHTGFRQIFEQFEKFRRFGSPKRADVKVGNSDAFALCHNGQGLHRRRNLINPVVAAVNFLQIEVSGAFRPGFPD